MYDKIKESNTKAMDSPPAGGGVNDIFLGTSPIPLSLKVHYHYYLFVVCVCLLKQNECCYFKA